MALRLSGEKGFRSAARLLISILQLGTVDYVTALRLQEKLVALRKDGQVGDVVLLLGAHAGDHAGAQR